MIKKNRKPEIKEGAKFERGHYDDLRERRRQAKIENAVRAKDAWRLIDLEEDY